MIFKRLELYNFGIYHGSNEFDLKPDADGEFNRPVILFRGQNGAGKTTILEAISLCLHGSLALGTRISRRDYEAHLSKRIHVPGANEAPLTEAHLELAFDYVTVGKRHEYLVRRAWSNEDGRFQEDIVILEDGAEIAALTDNSEKEYYLRELVPPGVANIFFFDGERLEMLVDDETSKLMLGETIRTLFGLNLVTRLQSDLDIYLTRQEDVADESRSLQQRMQDAQANLEQVTEAIASVEQEHHEVQKEIDSLSRKIVQQKQKIANHGDMFTQHWQTAHERRIELETELEHTRKQLQEMAGGLLPFAVAPQMLKAVQHRLELEQRYKQQQSAQRVGETLVAELLKDATWTQFANQIEPDLLTDLKTHLSTVTRQTIPQADIAEDDVILKVSEQEQITLQGWIEQALGVVAKQTSQVLVRLEQLEAEAAAVKETLENVPPESSLQPLIDELNQLSKQLQPRQLKASNLHNQLEELALQREGYEAELKRLREQLASQESHNRNIKLATKTQNVLDDYAAELAQRKVKHLSRTVSKYLKILNRKERLVDRVEIDPASFEVRLHKDGSVFKRDYLSAGEKQLLAIAIMWGLRDISNAPFPVVLDTPLGRLDKIHQRNMVTEYFPRAGHQVILLATDREIDAEMEALLSPAIAHSYNLPLAIKKISPQNQNGHLQLEQGSFLTDSEAKYETE